MTEGTIIKSSIKDFLEKKDDDKILILKEEFYHLECFELEYKLDQILLFSMYLKQLSEWILYCGNIN